MAELALPDLAGPLFLGRIQTLQGFFHQCGIKPVFAHFQTNAAYAQCTGTPVEQALGKPLVRLPAIRRERVEHLSKRLGIGRMGRELAFKFAPRVFPARQIGDI